MEGVLRTLSVNAEAMAKRLSLGYTQATDLADAIMMATGLPYQSAHLVVGQLVAAAVEAGIPAQKISGEMIDMAAQTVIGHPLDIPTETLAQVLDSHAIVATRTGLGGAAREPMCAMFAECHGRLAELETWRADTERRLTVIEEDLITQARKLVNYPKEKRRPFGVTGRVHETVEGNPIPSQAS
jgi:argininosuccinate lyase